MAQHSGELETTQSTQRRGDRRGSEYPLLERRPRRDGARQQPRMVISFIQKNHLKDKCKRLICVTACIQHINIWEPHILILNQQLPDPHRGRCPTTLEYSPRQQPPHRHRRDPQERDPAGNLTADLNGARTFEYTGRLRKVYENGQFICYIIRFGDWARLSYFGLMNPTLEDALAMEFMSTLMIALNSLSDINCNNICVGE